MWTIQLIFQIIQSLCTGILNWNSGLQTAGAPPFRWENSLLLADGSEIFINANSLHSFSQPNLAYTLQCPNIVFLDELIAPITSKIYQDCILPITTNRQYPYIILNPECAWQKEILTHLDYIFSLFQKYDSKKNETEMPELSFSYSEIYSICYETEVQNNLCQLWQRLPRLSASAKARPPVFSGHTCTRRLSVAYCLIGLTKQSGNFKTAWKP